MKAHYGITTFQRNTCVEHAHAHSIQLVLCQMCTIELNGWSGGEGGSETKK